MSGFLGKRGPCWQNTKKYQSPDGDEVLETEHASVSDFPPLVACKLPEALDDRGKAPRRDRAEDDAKRLG